MVAGYAVIFASTMALLTTAYLILGADWSFKPGSWEASAGWLALSIIVGLVTALAGGLVTQRLDRSGKGALILMAAIVVLGLWIAIAAGSPEASEPRTIASPSNLEAMQNAVQPVWINYLNPLLGCIGVFVATKLLRKR